MLDRPIPEDPPVVEFAIGVQFDRLPLLRASHLGRFWVFLGVDEWPLVSDAALIEDQFEVFDASRLSRAVAPHFRLTTSPVIGRMRLQSLAKDKMIQLQPTRLHFNWLKTSEAFRPDYPTLLAEFLGVFSKFSDFAGECDLGVIHTNQWEITYVDSFPRGEYWDTPADWKDVLPELFSELKQITTRDSHLKLDHRTAEWSFEIGEGRGRLYLSAGPGNLSGDEVDSLILTMTARGPITEASPRGLTDGLDLGHAKAFEVFQKIVNEKYRKHWEL